MPDIVLFALLLGAVFLLVALGAPVAFAMGTVAILGILVLLTPSLLSQVARVTFSYGTSESLIMIPFFVLMAELLAVADYPNRIFGAIHRYLSRVAMSLPISSILACAAFASVSGSSAATCAAIGRFAGPEMLQRGYSPRLIAGALTSGGTLGLLIPPSLSMVVYGIITETSITKLFIAGILPGVLLTILLVASVVGFGALRPGVAPREAPLQGEPGRTGIVAAVVPVLTLSILILVSLYLGWATPTEISAVGAVGALALVVVSGRLTWSGLANALRRTVLTSTMIMFLIFGGLALAFVLAALGLPDSVSKTIVDLQMNRWGVMIAIILFYLILGSFLDPMGMLVISVPSLFPIVTSLGFDPIWFGVIVTLNVELAMITPPVGINLFIVKKVVPDLSMEDILLGSLPFVNIILLAMAAIMVWPQIALVLVPK